MKRNFLILSAFFLCSCSSDVFYENTGCPVSGGKEISVLFEFDSALLNEKAVAEIKETAREVKNEEVPRRHHHVSCVRNHCRMALVIEGKHILPAQFLLLGNLHRHWMRIDGGRMEIWARADSILGRFVYAGVPRSDLQGEHAD